MRRHIVPDGVRALALARYLARAYPMLPGRILRETLKKRDVRVNGARAAADAVVHGGDTVDVYLSDALLAADVRTIYRDADIWAVEKPAGLPVDVDADGVGEDTLFNRLRRICPDAQLGHRLDTGTGGVLLASVSDAGEQILARAFRDGLIDKRYLAQLIRMPARASDTLTHYLVKDARTATVRAYDRPAPGGKRAQLKYQVVEQGMYPLVEIALMTGRTHQIRCQFAKIGCALVGDDKYGDYAVNNALGAHTPRLWCESITLDLPGYRDKPFVSKAGFRRGEGAD